jgi:AraC-like DNA-binding protein
MTKTQLTSPLYGDHLPESAVYRSAVVPANAAYPEHQHAWGEFVYSYSGVMEVKVGKDLYLIPPQYGFWLPEGVRHQGLNRYEAHHCSLYISRDLLNDMPTTCCALSISNLLRNLLEHLLETSPTLPYSEKVRRFISVIVDQLSEAPQMGSYLPGTNDPALSTVLTYLENHPDANDTLHTLATLANTTERTLSRRAQRDLGMPLGEWRNRLRVIRAMGKLEAGLTVENIALDLGYASASAFIAMFKRQTQTTPDEYRKVVQGNE